MSDYNFLKSGSGNKINISEEDFLKLQSLILLFTENAIKNAAEYVDHAQRTIIQATDLEKCMKVEAIIFCNKTNIIQQANDLLLDCIENEEKYNDDDLSDLITNDEEEYTLSKCKCSLCEVVNNIENLWANWEPETPIELSLKKNLDKFSILG